MIEALTPQLTSASCAHRAQPAAGRRWRVTRVRARVRPHVGHWQRHRSGRFSATPGSTRYSIGWNLNSNYALPAGSRTANSIVARYSQANSKFYAAWRPSTPGGEIEVASCTDGATWSIVTYGLAWSVVGPM